jgi:ATP-grasp domain
LGPSTSFPAMCSKSNFLHLVQLEELRFPKTVAIPAACELKWAPAEMTYPVVVKGDHSDGGRCVRVVNGDADLRAVVRELRTPSTWRARRFFGALLGSEALRALTLPFCQTVSLQEYIIGRPCNRAVVCWKGKVLAGISVEAVEVSYEHGPASVVRIIDHSEMTEACERMVKRLHLSGFVGFDFVVDAADRAWVLEMNPRVTPICHFHLVDGTSLVGALCTHMQKLPSRSKPASITRDLIALFPNEITRCPSSGYLLSCQHDVPWEEPDLVRVVLNQLRRTELRRRARRLVESYFPAVISGFVKVGLLEAGSASDSSPSQVHNSFKVPAA